LWLAFFAGILIIRALVEPTETHPDKLVDFWEWLVENRSQVSFVIIAALGIGMIVYVKKVQQIQDEESAADELLAASNPDFEIEGGNTNLTTSARFQKVADDNPGTAAAINASFLAASSLFDERAYDKAAMAFEKFHSSNPASALAPAALFGAAASWDAASQVEGAIKGYKNVVSQYRNSPEATQSRVALAKLYLAKSTPDTAEAKKLLDKVVADGQSDFISGFWEGEAQRLYDSLESGDKAIEAPIKLEQPGTSKNSGESGEPKKQPEKISPVPEKEENEKK
jgi:tetratricopeptide (TPR) repeat protein